MAQELTEPTPPQGLAGAPAEGRAGWLSLRAASGIVGWAAILTFLAIV